MASIIRLRCIRSFHLMKFAALILFASLAISSPAFAILRPRYPEKPSPPFQGGTITISDDSVRNPHTR